MYYIIFSFRCIAPYPAKGPGELELRLGDVVYVIQKRDDGWFRGILHRTGKTGYFPGSFVQNSGSWDFQLSQQ